MIGLFDSGHGGLTVLRAVIERLPDRDYTYLGDHGHAPYGARSVEDIYALTLQNVERLFSIGCRLVLLACNTASAVALRRLQQTWLPHLAPEHRVLGVVVPTIEAITRVPWHVRGPQEPAADARLVAVFATRRTVESGAYPYEIRLRAPAMTVVQQACPGLVDRVESDGSAVETETMVRGFVADLLDGLDGRAPDVAILGCTHYPLVAGAFAAALPRGVDLLRQPGIVAESLAAYLARHPEFSVPGGAGPRLRFFTTGDPGRVDALASRFFGSPVRFERLSAAPARG